MQTKLHEPCATLAEAALLGVQPPASEASSVRSGGAPARDRLDTRMATVVSEMKQQARTRGVAPVRDRAEGRPARMQLTRAAAIGPVLADMFLAAEPLGVG